MKRTRSRVAATSTPIRSRIDATTRAPTGDVTALAVLADVVQERPEQHGVAGPPIGELAHGLGLDGIVAGAVPREEPAPSPGASS